MKINYKKITAIASSVLLTSMTLGLAAAASSAPFVSGSSADVAVVYGTGVGVSQLDQVEAENIQADLSASLSGTGGAATATGGDSFLVEKTNTHFHLGDGITEVSGATIDDDELPTLLEAGVYTDDDNDEFDYTQEIELENLSVVLFENNDYAKDEPTIGVEILDASATEFILNYTLEFTDTPEYADLETTDLVMMGKSYYVLEADNETGLTLLDSASDTILNEDESTTVEGHEVSISFIGTDEVKLIVDGSTTNALGEGETQKLADGSYIGVKEILVQDYQGGLKQVEFSIGSGKLVLDDSDEVIMNDEDVDDVWCYITNAGTAGSQLDTIVLTWNADDDLFITETSDVTMPGFEAVKFSFGGVNFPAEEVISVENNGDDQIQLSNVPLKDTEEDIVLLTFNANTSIKAIGEDSDERLITDGDTSLTFDADTDTMFVASWNDGDDAESYLVRATNFKEDNDVNKTTIEYKKSGSWTEAKKDVAEGDDVSIGSIDLDIGAINEAGKSVVISTADGDVNFRYLYTEEGLSIMLPVIGSDIQLNNATNYSSYDLILEEEDEDGNIGDGATITLTLDTTGSDNLTSVENVDVSPGSDSFELDDTDDFIQYAYSALATKVVWDKTDDAKVVELTYHGEESIAQLFITAPQVTVSAGGGLGSVVVKDSEVSTVSGKNLIVVGGSCINSVAANILGGAKCTAAFTSATGIGSGQFLIKSVASPYNSAKVALLVAGYETADTQAASQYLRTQTVDTTVGKAYKGTSSTSATLIVE